MQIAQLDGARRPLLADDLHRLVTRSPRAAAISEQLRDRAVELLVTRVLGAQHPAVELAAGQRREHDRARREVAPADDDGALALGIDTAHAAEEVDGVVAGVLAGEHQRDGAVGRPQSPQVLERCLRVRPGRDVVVGAVAALELGGHHREVVRVAAHHAEAAPRRGRIGHGREYLSNGRAGPRRPPAGPAPGDLARIRRTR